MKDNQKRTQPAYEIRMLELAEIEDIYEHPAQRHFPENELKPLKSIRRMYTEGCYQGLGMYVRGETGEELAAYALFVTTKEQDALLLDYYAVLEGRRNSGTGSLFLQRMKELFRDRNGILLETEDIELAANEEERQTRTRRNAFYRRNGVKETQLRVSYCGADYQIFYMPICRDADETQIRWELEKVYRVMFQEKYEETVTMKR